MESNKEKMDAYLKSIGGLTYSWNTKSDPIVSSSFFDCEVGWYPLIQKLIEDLIVLGWDKNISQVKEKFGGLRFYIGSGTEEIFERIIQAEKESYSICEICGEPGESRRVNGWYYTLCDTHHQEKIKE
jgi:hypothetical protein